MSFTLPSFNLTANILRISAGTYVVVGTTDCNLAMGRRTALDRFAGPSPTDFGGLTPTLLCPAGTDIRDRSCGGNEDVLEVPAGSGRWYAASAVDDIGKGFANEHRAVTLLKVGWFAPWLGFGLSAWPTPIP